MHSHDKKDPGSNPPVSSLFKTRTDLAREARGAGPENFNRLSRSVDILSATNLFCDGASRETIIVDNNNPLYASICANLFKENLASPSSQAATQCESEDDEEYAEHALPLARYDSDLLSALKKIVSFVKRHFSTMPKDPDAAEDAIKALVEKYATQANTLPLSVFIENGLGLCRHAVLLVALLATELNKKLLQIDKIYRYRANLTPIDSSKAKPVGHAVVVIELVSGERLLLDSTKGENGVVMKLSSHPDPELESLYGKYKSHEFISGLNTTYNEIKQSRSLKL